MKKMNRTKAAKAARSGITALLAVVMAMPVSALTAAVTAAVSPETAVVEAADVEVPDPIMELDFEKGFQGEAAKNELKPVGVTPRLMYEERKENGAYPVDSSTGKWIFEWTDNPAIEGSTEADYHYVTGVVGNQPTTYDDPEMGNVFRLDSTMEIAERYKDHSDKMDFSVPVYSAGFNDDGTPKDAEAYEKSIIQPELTAHSAVQIKNPFAGMNFTEDESHWKKDSTSLPNGPQWEKGVTIAYWVKVPEAREATEDDDKDDILNDSVLFTFENIQRTEDSTDPNGENVTYHVDDLVKHQAAENYKEDDPQYALGTRETVKAKDGTEYIVAKDYGPLVRLNPNYEGTAEKKIYFEVKEGDEHWSGSEKITITTDAGETKNLYPLGPNIYNAFKETDPAKGSSIRRGYVNGSMQIAASDAFHFMEDDYATETQPDGSFRALKGAKDLNPNTAKEGEFIELRNNNLFYFEGDKTVTSNPDEWHYVVCVIQNDWVQFYVDGYADSEDDYGYHGTAFNVENGKKYFNKGFGIRMPYQRGKAWSGVADWSADGTIAKSPANAAARTMLEWLSDEDTVLYLGNQGCAAQSTDQEIGTLDGVLMDDIKFFAEPLTEEQATVLFDQATKEKAGATDIPKPVLQMNFEDAEVGSIPSGLTGFSANDTTTGDKAVKAPTVVNEATFGKVLKLHENKSQKTSALQFTNPFAGKDLSGVTISYWFRSVPDKNGDIGEGVTVTFADSPKKLSHDKMQPDARETETRTGLWVNNSCDAMFMAGVDTTVNTTLKNHYQQSTKKNGNTDPKENGYDKEADELEDEWNARLASTSEWHFATAVIKNSGIYMYFDGKKLDNNLADPQGPTFYGPRFYDGYYHKYLDSFSSIRYGSENAGATPLMTFLTQEDTTAYFGMMYRQGSALTYRATVESYLDDVNFYDVALNDEQIQTLYTTAQADEKSKSAVAGIAVDTPDWQAGGAAEDPTGPAEENKEETNPGTINADGSWSASANGVSVTLPAGSFPAEESLSLAVTILGAKDSAAQYTAANAALKGAGIDVDKQVITLYDMKVLKADGAEITPTAEASITLTPPAGYTASKTSIVRMADVKSMATSVSGSSLAYQSDKLGQFAVMQQKTSSASGDTSKTGTSKAGQTGDAASVAIPFVLLAAAFCTIVVIRRKEEALED